MMSEFYFLLLFQFLFSALSLPPTNSRSWHVLSCLLKYHFIKIHEWPIFTEGYLTSQAKYTSFLGKLQDSLQPVNFKLLNPCSLLFFKHKNLRSSILIWPPGTQSVVCVFLLIKKILLSFTFWFVLWKRFCVLQIWITTFDYALSSLPPPLSQTLKSQISLQKCRFPLPPNPQRKIPLSSCGRI